MCRGMEKWRNLHIFQDIGLILLKLGAGGYFWILNPKSMIKFLYDVILTSKWCEGKCSYIAYRKCILRQYDVTFGLIFLKTSIYLLLMTDYHHTKFGLIRARKAKLRRGGTESAPPGWECIKSPRWDRVKAVPYLLYLYLHKIDLMVLSF